MKVVFLISLLCFSFLYAVEYRILVSWDEMEGELNSVVSGTVGSDFAMVNGVSSASALDGQIVSIGEGRTKEAMQAFVIRAQYGVFSLWLRDKFADDDMQADMNLINQSKPVIVIMKDNAVLQQIKVPEGVGLTCKVFALDVESGEIQVDNRYYPKSRMIIARVVNALNGEPMSDVTCTLTDKLGNVTFVITDESGYCFMPVEVGEYRMKAGRKGYIPIDLTVVMGADEHPREVQVALTPEMTEYRIVLTWNAKPEDLDAHLAGPRPEGGNFHIWYRNKVLVGGKNFLDRDDTTGYGPETITIYKPADGEYTFNVHDYTHRDNQRSRWLSQSGARVQLYGDGRLQGTWEVPDGAGTVWHVFRITKDRKVLPVMTLDYVREASDIR